MLSIIQHRSTLPKVWLSFLLIFASNYLSAQFHDPVQWEMSYEKITDTEYDLIFTATIEKGWYVYSQHLDPGGPIPTSFNFEEGGHFEAVGDASEEGPKKAGHDQIFDMEVVKYYDQAVFKQRVNVSDSSLPISGYLEFMTCDDQQCLPPQEVEFSFALGEDDALLPSDGFLDPVKWAGAWAPINGDTFQLTLTATLETGWTIYSQHTDDNGPVPTEIGFDQEPHFTAVGEVTEDGYKKEGPDPLFNNVVVIKYTKSPVTFTQKFVVTDTKKPINGYVLFMTCDDKQCLPPNELPILIQPATGKVMVGEEADQDAVAAISSEDSNDYFEEVYGVGVPNPKEPLGTCGESTEIKKAGFWQIFVLGFFGGLLALLTPCVFPMIPLTVSFFTKGSENRRKGIINAILYGLSIFGIYLLLSIPFHIMDSVNSDILNQIATNVWLNILFFVVFLVFAISFFGFFEITLPSSWVNKSSTAENIGGFLGIFFMALTLALVSFSCTGPILGSLLAGALTSNGGAWQLTTGMGGFGLALALPFGLFAAFPGWMNSLPKSGGWLNTVKVVLGFLELGLAFKFLSNADLVKSWGLLKIEPFLIIWMVISLGLALYLFGIIKFPHDSKLKKLSVGRLSLGALAVAFTIYLGLGFRYNDEVGSYEPLKLLSGLAPPVCYSIWNPCDCPQGLSCFKNYEDGLAYAKEQNKPIMIDFTGYACVNCRKMEEHVWPLPKVYNRIKNDYVLISLYVDDKKALPEAQQKTLNKVYGGTRTLKNYGDKWQHFQEYFGANAQPYYVLLSPEEELLASPVGYTPDENEFSSFLDCGLNAFSRLGEK